MYERQIESRVKSHCDRLGIYCRKFVSPSSAGVPDRFLAKGGKVMFLELKREGNKMTPLQEREIRKLNEAGVHAVCTIGYQAAIQAIDDFFAEELFI
jgi:hypothetical protein